MTDFGAELGGRIPPPPRPVGLDDADVRRWWVWMLAGVALVAVGVWLVTNPYTSVTVLALLVGVSLVVAGVAEIMALGGRGGLGWAAWLSGGLVVAAGIVVLTWPDITLWALAVVAGCGLLVTGALRIAAAFEARSALPGRSVHLAIGVLSVVLGAVVLSWPEATLEVLGFLLGFKAVVTGLLAIGSGWQLHRLAS